MMYYISIVKSSGFITTTEAYPHDEAVALAKHILQYRCVNFGDGFWTRTGVYLGRIVASVRKNDV